MLLRRYDLRSRQLTDIIRTAGADDTITSFAISPDGGEIAYLRFDGANRNTVLEIVASGGGAAREIFRDRSTSASRVNGIAWSADRRYILFARDNVDGAKGGALWKVPAAGGPAEPTGVSASGEVRFPSVAPDGSRVAYVVGNQVQRAVWALENFLRRN
jgi:hypothetical protein